MLLLLLQEAQSANGELSKLVLSFRRGQMEGFCCAWKDSLRARLLNSTQYWLCEILALAHPPNPPAFSKAGGYHHMGLFKNSHRLVQSTTTQFSYQVLGERQPPTPLPSLPIPIAVTGSALINSRCWPSVLADHFVQWLIWIFQRYPKFICHTNESRCLSFQLLKNTLLNTRSILAVWPPNVTLHFLARLCCNNLIQSKSEVEQCPW